MSAQDELTDRVKFHIQSQMDALNLSQADIDELILSDMYSTEHNGASHFFFQQYHDGVPVFNASIHATLSKKGKILITGDRLVRNLDQKIKSSDIRITALEAVERSMDIILPSMSREGKIIQHASEDKHSFLFKAEGLSQNDIPVNLSYYQNRKGELVLCWNLEFDPVENADYWNIHMDASSGEMMAKLNYTSYCSFDHNSYNHYENPAGRTPATVLHSHDHSNTQTLNNSMYKVFPFPGESPIHIAHTVEVDPEDTLASPFGWHDTDGEPGAEYTITRGNNVHAYLDEFDLDQPSSPEPDGGEELHFLFEHDDQAEPEIMKEAAVTNLFYANNRVHDLLYRFGFDELAGNFQANNYGRGGEENDYVNAEAFDASGTNNANFSTPSDGANGRMQMYLWSGAEGLRLEIHEPLEISGLYETATANFGLNMDFNTKDGQVAIADDGTNSPTLACEDLINGNELEGKIALIDRGICEFGSKVLHAEQSGAIAALICNVAGVNGGTGEELTTMGAGDEGEQVTIPSLFLKKSTCDLIKIAIAEEKEVNITMGLQQSDGPSSHAASFDNGVISHEYGHGLSNRLTGGPSNSSCLYNFDVSGDGEPDGEQMGEGWSDFYALILTSKEGDAGEDARGIGTYVSGQKTDGKGIRHFPYSTDMNVSPVTYDFIKTTNVPHGVGEVWAAALWDLYWRMIDLYGFDPTWENVESGNFKAVLLVTDAMKIQVCNPGFLDGRDAILLADEINNDGEHECLIWEVFARRGMGYYAVQGDPFDHRDNAEDFESLPTCIQELKLKSKHKEVVVPGENIDMQLLVSNHKIDSVTQVTISENLPQGMSYVESSSNWPASVTDGILYFDLGTIQSNEELTIDYKLHADPSIFSTQKFLDQMEEDDGNWIGLNNVGFDTFWEWVDFASASGDHSWYIEESALESDVSLIMFSDPIPIDGDFPVLCFQHAYNTEDLSDGGFVEYSNDYGNTWKSFKSEDFILNSYDGDLAYGTLAIPGLEAFYGNSEGFIKSYIDLSHLKGEELVFSFRYATDDNTIVDTEYPGWFVDDVEVIDLKKYEHSICISSAENDYVCVDSKLMIDSKLPDAITETKGLQLNLLVGPNPAQQQIRLFVESPINELVDIQILSQDGKSLYQNRFEIYEGEQSIDLSTSNLSSGSYWIAYHSALGVKMNRLIIHRK